jgi:polyphosphate kinase 2 (PPK2 family)
VILRKARNTDLKLLKQTSAYTVSITNILMQPNELSTLTQEKNAPWVRVESEEQNFRDITVAKTILKHQNNILSQLDLTKGHKKSEYKKKLVDYQKELNELCWQAFHQKKSISLFWKVPMQQVNGGGAIRRVMQSIDARVSRVISITHPLTKNFLITIYGDSGFRSIKTSN